MRRIRRQLSQNRISSQA